jgi:hypothetical protein
MSQQGRISDDGTTVTAVETLTGNSGGAVGPDGAGNIDVLGSGAITVTGNPGANTLTIDSDGTIPIQFDANSGSAVPALGILNIVGSTTNPGTSPLVTSGAGSTITIINQRSQALALADSTKVGLCNFDSDSFGVDANGFVTLDGSIASVYVTDSGNAIPINGEIDILGQAGFLETTGATNVVTVNLTPNTEATAVHAWNGSIIETPEVSVSSDGVTITLSVEQIGGGDLTVVFSDGFYDWDTTPPDTISLTAGTDTVPTFNYIYFLQSTKALTVSTVGFPTAEHAPIATVLCQSAATLQADKAYSQQGWTDEVFDSITNDGHIQHINFWIRQQLATYFSGVDQTYTITTNIGTPDNVFISTTAGVVLQLHENSYPAFADADDYYVINDSVTPFLIVNDLNALLTDSNGVSMEGRWFSLVLWGAVSVNGASKRYINLPSGSYANQTDVEQDPDRFSTYTIPDEFKNTGFLISEWKLRHNAASGGTWTSIEEIDLRGQVPNSTAGGGGGTPSTFSDAVFRIFDNIDESKLIAFQADQITTATTRTITMSDYDIDLSTVCISAPTDSGTAIPSLGALTFSGGTGISTSASGSTVTITGSGGGITWNVETGTSATMAVNNGYIGNNAGTVTFTLPTTAAVGDIVRVTALQGVWSIAQNAGETIYFGSSSTTTGAGGSLTSTNPRDAIELVCVVANNDWQVLSSVGNITVV